MRRSRLLAGLVVTIAMGWAGQLSATPMLLLDLQAANYNPTTGLWTDSSGNNDNASSLAGSRPTLVSGVTPNGSAAVNFTSGEFLTLTSSIAESPSGNGFTVFTYEASNGDGNSKTIVSGGGTGGGFQYRVGGDGAGEVQEVLRQSQANLGHSNTALGTTFHLIDVAANSSGAAFRTDGAGDGTASGSAFGTPLSSIGTANGGEFYVGDIAEIRVYAGVLSSTDILSVEAQMRAEFVTPVPEPSGLALAALGGIGIGGLLVVRRRREPRPRLAEMRAAPRVRAPRQRAPIVVRALQI